MPPEQEISGYRKLQVYEKSYAAVLAVYRMTGVFPKEEQYDIVNQMRRASMSIPLNIAEGYAKRESQQEFKRFLMMAIGSANEMSVLIDIARDLRYIGEEQYTNAANEYDKIGRMLNVLIQRLGKRV